MTPSRVALSFAAFLLIACAKENATPGARRMDPISPVRSDSAGVAMMVHSATAYEEAPDVAIDTQAMVVMHGSADNPDDDISTVDPVLFLADGRLIGVDRQRQQVMVFGADGGTRVAFGRKGNGPGEFGFINGVIPAGGDSLLVFDPGNGRATIVSPDTGLGREYPLAEAMGLGGNGAVALVGNKLLTTGMNVPGSADQPPGVKGVVLDLATNTAELVFATGPSEQDEAKPREITTANGSVMAMRAVAIKPMSSFPEAFGWQEHYVVSDGNHFRFEIRDIAGKVIAVLRVDRPRVAVTDAMWQSYIDDQVRALAQATSGGGATVVIGGGGGGPDTAAVRQRMEGEEHADSLPAYRDVHVTPDGTLWVTDYPVPGDSGWAATAFTTDGRILGRVTSPTGSAPVAFGDDRLAFRTEDDLGIATITIHRIHFFK